MSTSTKKNYKDVKQGPTGNNVFGQLAQQHLKHIQWHHHI